MAAIGQDGRSAAVPARNRLAISPFQTMTFRNPHRRRTGLAARRMRIDPALLANVTSPLAAAVQPKPSCSIIGSRNGIAPAAIRLKPPPMTERPNVGSDISRRSSTGCGWILAWRTYSAPLTSPTATIAAANPADVSPRLTVSRPNIRHASETPDISSPSKSKLPPTGSRTFGM